MKTIGTMVTAMIHKPVSKSHKGQNGRVLIIAGSLKFHGALLLAVQAASRVVDIVYVYTTKNNVRLIERLKDDIAVFIPVRASELAATMELVDVIAIGPGMSESATTFRLTEKILKKYSHKKTVIDATALWHLNPKLLHKNCVITPHSREFENVFKCKATADAVFVAAKKYKCIIVKTGAVDYISNGREIWQNKTGDVGMTKGGTGDVLFGIVAALSCTNSLLTAALAGAYLNGKAGELVAKKTGGFYNAQDLVQALMEVWKKYVKNNK